MGKSLRYSGLALLTVQYYVKLTCTSKLSFPVVEQINAIKGHLRVGKLVCRQVLSVLSMSLVFRYALNTLEMYVFDQFSMHEGISLLHCAGPALKQFARF